jgi:two-component system, NarL family, nitrate/nitrite sensor histidine kinase NarX
MATRPASIEGGVRSNLANLSAGPSPRIQPGQTFGMELFVLPAVLVALLMAQIVASLIAASVLWQLIMAVAALATCALYVWQVRSWLIVPMRQLRAWAVQMCSGDLSARIPMPENGEFKKLVFHVNRLSDALDRLANDMDDVVSRQTEQLGLRNHSLETLYEVAAALNHPTDADVMLSDAAAKLATSVDASAVLLRIEAEQMSQLIDVNGMQDTIDGVEAGQMSLPSLPGPNDVRVSDNLALAACGWNASATLAGTQLVGVPITYRGAVLGSIELLRACDTHQEPPDPKLLRSVGGHIGMVLEKHRADLETRNMSIMRERNSLAHELHDSLAQTVVSLNMQIKMLKESLEDGNVHGARREAQRLQGGVEEANMEVRELLASFRAPVDSGGLYQALRDLVQRMDRQWDADVYFQFEGDEPRLSPTVQLQISRIVGEALVNAHKHSEARILRVLAKHVPLQGLYILVEDDGAGIGGEVLGAHPGEHLGLAIMRERAQRAGGNLTIESDPDEGTRVELKIPLSD